MTETPKQYSARHLRLAIERAKIAVIEAQEQLAEFRGNPAEPQSLMDSALTKLDCAWRFAAGVEAREKEKLAVRRESVCEHV